MAILSIVGISYGPEWMVPRAIDAVRRAETVIGYEGFIEQVRPLLAPGAHAFDVIDDLGKGETVLRARARHAASAVTQGRRTIILSSGDPAMLGMAGPVLRHLSESGLDEVAAKCDIVPGLSAHSLAAAALGAPLMNGYATLALCIDGLDDAVLKRRIAALGAGDLVAVVYMLRHNAEVGPDQYPHVDDPTGHTRRRQRLLVDGLASHRDPSVPCGLVARVGRPDNAATLISLADLLNHLETAPRESVLIVGSSETEMLAGRMVTRSD